MKLLSFEETCQFLTKAELKKFEKMITEGKLEVEVEDSSTGPYLEIRGSYISFFALIAAIGTL